MAAQVLSESLLVDKSMLTHRKVLSKKEAVFFIEKAWIRFRQHLDGLKIREYLRSVPYECRRSYVKYYDLKHKTIRLKTDVDRYTSRMY